MRSIWSLLSAALLVGVGPAVVDASLLQPVTPIPIESSQQSCFMETAFMIDRPPSNDPYTMFTDHCRSLPCPGYYSLDMSREGEASQKLR